MNGITTKGVVRVGLIPGPRARPVKEDGDNWKGESSGIDHTGRKARRRAARASRTGDSGLNRVYAEDRD